MVIVCKLKIKNEASLQLVIVFPEIQIDNMLMHCIID